MIVKFFTLGCKVNQYETQWLRTAFLANGWSEAEQDANENEVDLVVVNTCSVTLESDAKSRKTIAHCAKTYPNAEIVVIGCYAASDPDAVAALPNVTETIPDKRRLPEFLARRGLVDIPTSVSGLSERRRAYVKVQDGCRVGCAYCIIPKTRPYLHSRPIEEIVEEVRTLSANGYREIVLTGIHLGHYGLDFSDGARELEERKGALTLQDYLDLREKTAPERRVDLARLLRALTTFDSSLLRVRLGSLEAVEVTDEVLNVVEERADLFCPHFHLSMQSGDDSVLLRMKRRWSSEPFIEKCRDVCARIADAALSTDVIVGFPGETDANFQRTVDVVRALNFSKTHVFRFSARPGTLAAEMKDQIPESVKKERAKLLIEVARQEREKFARRFLGRTTRFVVEGIERDANGRFVAKGSTERYYDALAPLRQGRDARNPNVGDFVRVALKELDGDVFRAELLD